MLFRSRALKESDAYPAMAETPLIDTRKVSTGATFGQAELMRGFDFLIAVIGACALIVVASLINVWLGLAVFAVFVGAFHFGWMGGGDSDDPLAIARRCVVAARSAQQRLAQMRAPVDEDHTLMAQRPGQELAASARAASAPEKRCWSRA